MRNYARFIPGEEIDAVEQWCFGAIDTAAQLLAEQEKARENKLDEAQSTAMRQESYQVGYEAGLVNGRVQAEEELQKKMADFMATQARDSAQRLMALLDAARSQLEESRQTIALGVLELSCELARQVLRQELSVNPNVLLPVIREAVELLGAEHRSAVVRLHPADVEVFEGLLSSGFAGMALNLRSDPTLQPGDCLVESAGMVVDASLKKRWQRAVATLGLASAWEDVSEPS